MSKASGEAEAGPLSRYLSTRWLNAGRECNYLRWDRHGAKDAKVCLLHYVMMNEMKIECNVIDIVLVFSDKTLSLYSTSINKRQIFIS